MYFAPWPQTQLLVRLAGVCPDDLADTVTGIPATDNLYVTAAIVDVARALPIERVPELLRDALTLSGHAEPAHQLVERLATLSSEHPREAAELLGAVAESEGGGWHFTLWDESAAQIIKTGIPGGDPEAARLAGEAASRAAARGHAQWLEFLTTP